MHVDRCECVNNPCIGTAIAMDEGSGDLIVSTTEAFLVATAMDNSEWRLDIRFYVNYVIVTVFYVFGMVGNLMAIYAINTKTNFKNKSYFVLLR